MFTGLVEDIGTIRRVTHRSNYLVLAIASKIADETLQEGESVSCDGACLTVVSCASGEFVVEASQETAARTILNTYRVNTSINLERAVRAGDRLGGHLVTGHIDCVARLESATPIGGSVELAIAYESEFDPLVVEKGSIAINGVSLTINNAQTGWASVNLIPFTVASTTLGSLKVGDSVNIEFDLIGKYVAKAGRLAQVSGLTMKKLLESGW